MAFKILGVGNALPKFMLDNQMLSKMVDTSDDWITSRTGIKTRGILTDEKLLDLSVAAANKALNLANIKADSLDLIICTTLMGDTISPYHAAMVQKSIGANCHAFDMNVGCSGFVYALEVASAYFKSNLANRILIVSAEHMSNFLDYNDRSTCILFGDGAGAVVLEKGENLLSMKLITAGDDSILRVTRHAGNFPYEKFGFNKKEKSTQNVWMDGQQVYMFAVNCLVNSIQDAAKQANININEIDYFLPHQANMRIIEAARIKLGIAKDKILSNIERVGNTTSASIPIMLAEYVSKFKRGMKLLLSTFGGGMSGGSALIKW
ncbi:MAG: beta-ketoacyl-ACP synthase 3 [Firmicutes bacterium]|nr:beta-ketoacyl-ACP synthase 3 [Bacillota bacterium]